MAPATYIFAGGGSGGHLYPGLAVAGALHQRNPEAELLFLATTREIDQTILDPTGFRYIAQPVLPLPSRVGAIWPFWRAWRRSVAMCRRVFEETRPAAVLGLGGFASGPAMKVASKMGIPTAMLNPDALPGKANRYCMRYAQRIFIQWQSSLEHFGRFRNRCLATGCPIRMGFSRRIEKAAALAELGLDPNRKTLVIVGGSQGGRNVNDAFIRYLSKEEKSGDFLLKDWQMVQITGPSDYERVRQAYETALIRPAVWAYSQKMIEVLHGADLVISRAGASTLAELTATGTPSILMPYPYHKDQHQRHNARVLEACGAARIVTDEREAEMTSNSLKKALEECLKPGILDAMRKSAATLGRPDAADAIADELRDWEGKIN